MAHEISIRENGFAEMAFMGSRQKIWHGLGSEVPATATFDEWRTLAGMDWEVFESAVSFNAYGEDFIFPDKKVLFRSDTKAPLSIVGDGFKIVQPNQILEFFRDLCENNNMELSTAGVLFGGKRFWALAKLGKDAEIVDGDVIRGYLLLTTAVDGTLATTAKFVSERVVCSNTLTIAMNEDTKNFARVVHSATWDATQVKIDLGLVDSAWDKFITNMRDLTQVAMNDYDVKDYFQAKFYNPKVPATDQTWGAVKKVNDLMSLYKTGNGSEFSYGTAWGVVNAVTDLYTHGNGRKKDPSKKFWDAYIESDKIKQDVVDDMLALV